MTEAEIAEVERLVHAFADAHREAERLGDGASIGEVRASVVTCDDAYCALMEAVRRLAQPKEEP